MAPASPSAVQGANGPAVAPRSTKRPKRTWTAYIPPQHGAWAFLIVPLLVGFTTAPFRWASVVLSLAWVVAYPVGYFGGRALATRIRRGSWTRLARREARRALPWAVALVVLGIPLVVLRPWLLAVAVVVAALWGGSMLISLRGSERALSNDALLVVLAVIAVPLVWAVGNTSAPGLGNALSLPGLPPAPAELWWATAATGVYLFGSVLHVKSLLREAKNRRFHWLSVGYHGLALVCFALVSPAWILGFAPALARALVMRPGLRPGIIGVFETVAALLFLAAAVLVG